MNPAEVAALIAQLKSLAPAVLDAVHDITLALKGGHDPTPAERHLEVQAAFAMLGIKDE